MDERELNQWMAERGYELREDGWHKVGRVAPDAQRERNTGHEPVAESAGKNNDPKRYRVCITSYRCRLLDERNLYDKYFVDALQYAGAIYSDAPQWCKVEVRQYQVGNPGFERTEIEITKTK